MSDLLSGLRLYDAEFIWALDTGYETPMGEPLVKLADVREALTNPTDEQVWAIVKSKFPPWAHSELEADLVRAVLAAAAAGGDQ